MLQSYRTIQIEKLAALMPIPIKYESRRRHLQRFLILPQLNPKCVWFPIIKKWLKINQTKKRVCYVAIDRTRWQERNLFVASLIKNKRAIPLNWMLLDKKGNSNLREQKRLLKSTLKLLKGYEVIVIGDREFGNVNLADWLSSQCCQYVLRTKSSKYIQLDNQNYQQLLFFGSKLGKSFYIEQVKFTKQPNMARTNLAFYWSNLTKSKTNNEGWYLINNLSSLQQTIKAYKKRMGIEAMFKDCKSGGYNLEKCQGSDKRLLSLILLIAIAYTCAITKGQTISFKRIKEYVCRLQENQRRVKRHSNFWIGLYGSLWVNNFQFCHHWVEKLIRLTPNKLPFYQQGLKAKTLILASL
ncbi:IS4 family transposase [Myxosarcina sp. GI1]|uniref:IS4 family transposase n=1 Tax=Myxosarcina sp. GI1 TaxID=1541065 RepID=UPI0009E06F52|nr:IS4 family transposase [Myxosarcina sp. GI1]